MSLLSEEIAAFDRMKADLEAEHFGQWVLFKGAMLVGAFETFEATAERALDEFGNGPYLIRQIGAGPIHLSASVTLRPLRASDAGRV